MDLELLSRMVGELLIEHDQVGLPGVGTFVAEMVPASFSDKGFTINPPYRRLSFSPSPLEDTLLIDFYADSNQIDREAAAVYLTQYLAELKSVLVERKTVALLGLGRLRATRENTLFFVAEEGLDIFPSGIGLRPVSLKSHLLQEDPVVIRVPLPVLTEAPVAVEPVPEEPQPEPIEPIEPAAPIELTDQPEQPEQPEAEEPEPVAEEPEQPVTEEPERPATEEPQAEQPIVEQPVAEQPVQPEPQPKEEKKKKKGMPWWGALLLTLFIIAILALIVFVILARVAPEFIDSILYTPEELRILNY